MGGGVLLWLSVWQGQIHRGGGAVEAIAPPLATACMETGLSKQLAKICNSSLNTTHSARNLGFIFDEHLTFSDQISSVSKSRYYYICQLHCIRPYLDSKTASTIATFIVQCTPSLTTATFFITTCPSVRLPGSNRSRTLLHVLLSKLPNPVTSFPSFGLCTG